MRYNLFAFDLDGTLLDQNGKIPPETLEFVRKLRTKAEVTLASGRSLTSALPFIELLEIKNPVILYHGALIYEVSEGRALRELYLPGEAAWRALCIAKQFFLSIQVYLSLRDPIVYVPKVTPENQRFLAKERLRARVVDLEGLVKDGVLKILLIGDPRTLPGVAVVLREEIPEANVVHSEREYLEVLPLEASKGKALVWLCGELGVPLHRVVAVGDQESDVSMIEAAGLGVAMAHAPEGVREKADLVVSHIVELARVVCRN